MLTKKTKSLLLLSVILTVGLGGVGAAPALEVGEKAPDFLLPSATGDNISLSQFQGKKHVLIEFYTGDFDPT